MYRSRALWKCGKAELSLRGFSKPLWESAIKKMVRSDRWRISIVAAFPQAGPLSFSFLVTFFFFLIDEFPLWKTGGSRYEQLPLLGQRLQETFERDQLGQW